MKLRYLLLMIVTFSSCDDIIEVEDISNQNIQTLAPQNNTEVAEGAINFSWNKIEDVTVYHIQIAVPNFSNASQVVLDSLVTSSSFTKTLVPSDYEWRVKGVNDSYQTNFTTNNFKVVE